MKDLEWSDIYLSLIHIFFVYLVYQLFYSYRKTLNLYHYSIKPH